MLNIKKLFHIILIIVILFSTFLLCQINNRDGDYNYYIEYSDKIPFDHPFTFILLNIINLFLNNQFLSVDILIFISFSILNLMVYFFVFDITKNYISSMLSICFLLVTSIIAFNGTQLKTIIGLSIFLFLCYFINNKKNKPSIILFIISIFTHILSTIFSLILLLTYLFKNRKKNSLLIIPILIISYFISLYIPFFYDSNIKILFFIKNINIYNIINNIIFILNSGFYREIFIVTFILNIYVFIRSKKTEVTISFFIIILLLLFSAINQDYIQRFFMVLPYFTAILYGLTMNKLLKEKCLNKSSSISLNGDKKNESNNERITKTSFCM